MLAAQQSVGLDSHSLVVRKGYVKYIRVMERNLAMMTENVLGVYSFFAINQILMVKSL
jgi:hypothetical protein